MFYHIYIPTPNPKKHIFLSGKNPWHNIGVGDERERNEDGSGGLTFSF